MPGEQVVFEGKIPFKAIHFSRRLLWLALLGWNAGLLVSCWQSMGESIKITTQRIVLAKGVFRQDVEEVEFYRVTDIQSYQGILDRLTGIGTITLLSDDTTAPTLHFRIHSPSHYREIIRECVNRERKRMRTVQFD